MYRIKDLYIQQGKQLNLELVAGQSGLNNRIVVPEAERPGLSLTGYVKSHASKRIHVFGRVEIEYLRSLDPKTRTRRLEGILSLPIPAVIVARRYRPPKELLLLCEKYNIPLFRTNMSTMNFLTKLMIILTEVFSECISCHGTLVEVFGVGILIQGDSSVGKSEAALGLIERGHRLISDDVVRIKKKEGTCLEGFGVELTKHHMEIRGIGIINVAHLYGAVCIRDSKSIDMVVKLEVWDESTFYDRVGIEEKTAEFLSISVPFHVLPVKPGRDVVLLLETIALNHRLKDMGYNSAKEFNTKLLETIAAKSISKQRTVVSGKMGKAHENRAKGKSKK